MTRLRAENPDEPVVTSADTTTDVQPAAENLPPAPRRRGGKKAKAKDLSSNVV